MEARGALGFASRARRSADAQRAARAPLSLLLPIPGGERSSAVQVGSRMHLRCWALSHRAHWFDGELLTNDHRRLRPRSRRLIYALNFDLSSEREK